MTTGAALPPEATGSGLPPLDAVGEDARARMAAVLAADGDLAAHGRALMRETDARITALKAETPPAAPLACKAGCAWCCHQGVDVTVPEAQALMAHVEKHWTARAKRELVERVNATAARTRTLTALERQLAGLPCAFLDPKGACRVYEARPLLCRATLAADADRCRRAFVGGETGTEETWRAPIAWAKQMVLGTAAAWAKVRGGAGVYELHALLAAAFAAKKG